MTSIKKKILEADDGSKFSLTEYEWNFINNLMVNTELVSRQNNMSAAAFLSYIAGTRLGFAEGENLQFKLDEKTKSVTITQVPPEDDAKT